MRPIHAMLSVEHGCSDVARFVPSIRNRLTALKKNRGEFIKSSDVNQLYQAIVKQGQSILPSHTQSAVQTWGNYDGTLTLPHSPLSLTS